MKHRTSSQHFPAAASTQGYVLLEALAAMVIIGVIINLGLSVFVTSQRLMSLNAAQLERSAESQTLRGLFYQAVRQSTETVPQAGPYQSQTDVLVLHSPNREREMRYTALGNLKDTDAFCYAVLYEEAGEWLLEDFRTLDRAWTALRFESAPNSRLITLHWRGQPLSPDSSEQGAPYTFAATPRLAQPISGDSP